MQQGWLRERQALEGRDWLGVAVLAATVAGFVLRIEPIWGDLRYAELPPDAEHYRHLAVTMSHPLDTLAREPAWPDLIWAWTLVFGESPSQVRILSALLATAMIPASFLFAWLVTGRRLVALITCGLVAFHPALIDHAALGLREELQTLGLMAFASGALASADRISTGQRVALMAVGGGIALNTNLSLFTVVAVGLVIVGITRRLPLRPVAVVAVVIAATIAPHLARTAGVFGDPLHAANIRAVWYRNYEFMPGGCDGCPTLAEYDDDAYTGSRITWTEYMFDYHSMSTVLTRSFDGATSVLLESDQELDWLIGADHLGLWALYLVGVGVAMGRRRWDVLALYVATLGGTAFVVPLGIDRRLLMSMIPFAAMFIGWAVAELVDLARRAPRETDGDAHNVIPHFAAR